MEKNTVRKIFGYVTSWLFGAWIISLLSVVVARMLRVVAWFPSFLPTYYIGLDLATSAVCGFLVGTAAVKAIRISRFFPFYKGSDRYHDVLGAFSLVFVPYWFTGMTSSMVSSLVVLALSALSGAGMYRLRDAESPWLRRAGIVAAICSLLFLLMPSFRVLMHWQDFQESLKVLRGVDFDCGHEWSAFEGGHHNDSTCNWVRPTFAPLWPFLPMLLVALSTLLYFPPKETAVAVWARLKDWHESASGAWQRFKDSRLADRVKSFTQLQFDVLHRLECIQAFHRRGLAQALAEAEKHRVALEVTVPAVRQQRVVLGLASPPEKLTGFPLRDHPEHAPDPVDDDEEESQAKLARARA